MTEFTDGFIYAAMQKEFHSEIRDGDIREVNLPVKVAFIWSDRIASQWDDDGNALEYTSGFIMDVLPQKFVYNGGETKFLFDAYKNKT